MWRECGRAISHVADSDKANPQFVEYDSDEPVELDHEEKEENDSGGSAGSEICTFTLFEDYLNNDLKLL